MSDEWNEVSHYTQAIQELKDKLDTLPWSKKIRDYCEWFVYIADMCEYGTVHAYMSSHDPKSMSIMYDRTKVITQEHKQVTGIEGVQEQYWLVVNVLCSSKYAWLKEHFYSTFNTSSLVLSIGGDNRTYLLQQVDLLRNFISDVLERSKT
jgi:hypothetical protein